MAIASSVKIRFEDLRVLPLADLVEDIFIGVGGPFLNPPRMIKIQNTTNADIFLSFNGVDVQDVVVARSAFIYDYGSNQADAGGLLEQCSGERVYALYTSAAPAPTVGNVYVTVIYAARV